MIVGAEMQAITYNEFLPLLLGDGALRPYDGYREDADPSITNSFATAAYRVGHTMLSPTLRRVTRSGSTVAEGDLSLADAFFDPTVIAEGGIESLLRGLVSQRAQEIDTRIVDEVRNLLFGAPGAGGLDLAALNIQRGRDHGLPSYAQSRAELGLPAVTAFDQISSDAEVTDGLASVYERVEDVDRWVGGIAEDHVPGAVVGETLRALLAEQFEDLRDGDRFFYLDHLPEHCVRLVERQTLRRIMRRNTRIGGELTRDPWHAR